MLERVAEDERRKYLRAGLVAATIINVNRRKGTPLVKPEDFIRERLKPEDFMSPEEATAKMDAWSKTQNAAFEREQSFEVEGLITGGGIQ